MWRMVAGGPRPWEPPNPVSVESRSHAFVRGSSDPLPSASELGKSRFSTNVLELIDRCLTLSETERVQGCKELLGVLTTGSARAVEAETHKTATRNPEPTEVTVRDEVRSGEDTTAENAGTESLNLAGFASRLVAGVVDAAVLIPILVLILVMFDAGDNKELVAILSPGVLAYQIALGTLMSTTIGGLVSRIRVVRSDGVPLQFADALRRAFSITFFLGVGVLVIIIPDAEWLISWADEWMFLPSHFRPLLGMMTFTAFIFFEWIWALWDPRNQSLHDKMANTYVVRTRPQHDVFLEKRNDQKRRLDHV